ncbi:BTAD domain-containing putative transcriptional regulator [Dactylosporangium sp. NPDC049525]|uniref:AfsR/SARP family transcriptional regulator n=1 Tax=Dactylosporangium sp. NPDC049525 TaxID=3154730 RepID=UPI003431E757
MEFRLLGTIEAVRVGVPVAVGPARQRGVLAALLADAGRVVRTGDLVERVWGDARPRRATPTLYSYLSRLRAALDGGPALIRRAGGYLLAAEPATVDLHRFRDLCTRARAAGDDPAAAALFDEALGLWQGTAFADLDTPYFNLLRATAERERLAAEADRDDVRLRIGRAGEALAGLFARAEAHPLDERTSGQLMLALYRVGRAADALAHYRLARARLREELGNDPGEALQRLHKQLLAGTVPPVVVPAVPASAGNPPRQLPAPPAVFVGRAGELAQLDRIATADAMGIAAIGGIGGIGKTWLALHWAHRNAERFPEGQLYADLRGFDPTGEPVPATVALRGFLEALGVTPGEIPDDLDNRATLYRSLLAGRRVLVLLDNARSTAQIEPLLPGSPACMVLVTGRRQLAGLVTTTGARPVTLDALPSAEGRELLMRHVGRGRAAREPEAADALVAHCAGLPLATSIVAARARIQSALPLAALAEELSDRAARLDALDADDLGADLRAVFAVSYQALEPALARIFGLLGDAPGPDIGVPAAAALTGQPAGSARAALRRLTAAHLLQEHAPGRYRMHDLVHLYAAECCAHDQPAEVIAAARERLTNWYADTAVAADRALAPHRTPLDGVAVTRSFTDSEAMDWFAAEHKCLAAAQQTAAEHGSQAAVWRLAWALDTFHWRGGRLAERVAALRAALPATTGDPAAAALCHRLLGRAHVPLGGHDLALHHLERAAAGFAAAGDADGQAQTHLNLALAWERVGDDRQALHHARENLRIRSRLGNPAREAEALNAAGWYHARVQEFEPAERYCRRALSLSQVHGFREIEAYTRDSLGYIAHHGWRPADALEHYRAALDLRRALGDTYEEADTLVHLADVLLTLGRDAEATSARRSALTLYESQGRTREAAALKSPRLR